MIYSKTIRQIVSYKPVCYLLEEALDELNEKGYKVISVHETKVYAGIGCSNQGFIIIYDTNEENK